MANAAETPEGSLGSLGLRLLLALRVTLEVGHGCQEQQDDSACAGERCKVGVPAICLHDLGKGHTRIGRTYRAYIKRSGKGQLTILAHATANTHSHGQNYRTSLSAQMV